MEKKQVILSIDGATKTGWAVYKNGEIMKHGTKKFNPDKRAFQYGKWLGRMIGEYGITHIAAEDIFREHNRTQDKAFLALAKMQGVLEYVANESGAGLALLNPLQVKGYMIPSFNRLDRGNDKVRMVARVKGLGYQLKTDKADDEADAIGIMITYLANNRIPVTHPKSQRQ